MQSRPDFLGAFESTYLPEHAVDVAEVTGHDALWQNDIDAVLAAGVRRLRYPLRWHRIEADPGHFDWSTTDAVLGHLHDRGAVPIVDLVHHTSYPTWLDDGFRDRRFGPVFLRYAEAVASRYPWLSAYTLFNEPFATLFLAGHQGLWPPYDRGTHGFVRLLANVLPAVGAAARCWSQLLPGAEHVWVDTCEHHAGSPGRAASYAKLANDRRHAVLDLALGHDLDLDRPFVHELLSAGGEGLLELPALPVHVLGLDYYPHSEWWYDEDGGRAPSPRPIGFAALAEHYADRYGLPMMLTETNLRGQPSDRASWLRYMLEQYEIAVARGVPLGGYCWFPYLDSCDWDSLLARPAGRPDPVGVVSLGPDLARIRTVFTSAWEAAAAGMPAAELPAYRLQPPCDELLSGYLAKLDDWPWQDPPPEQVVPPLSVDDPKESLVSTYMDLSPAEPDLVVLSHLRWGWVWQRPQHLVSRFARMRADAGARTWFVEEPIPGHVSHPQLRIQEKDGVTVVRLVVPKRRGQPKVLGFDAEGAEGYAELLVALLHDSGRPASPDVLVYTPMAYDIAKVLEPGRLVYDVMDDLAAFLKAPEGLRLRQKQVLAAADVVFTGGRSLHRSVSRQRKQRCYLFPSGVETSHYAASRELRQTHPRPVAGYVGVIDERLDLELLAGLADALPDWTVRVVGPIAKIKRNALPIRDNLEYPGFLPYEQLPQVLAGFDVALMPFARNEATEAISPTKTLEYLAAGLPVVSTRVPDVVAEFEKVVYLADDMTQFAAACRTAVERPRTDRDSALRALLARREWDAIASAMATLIDGDRVSVRAVPGAAEETA